MRMGQWLGTPIGEPIINLEAARVSNNGNLVRVTWDTKTEGPCFFQIWVDGRLQTTCTKLKRECYVSVNGEDNLHFIEVITVGVNGSDEDCYHLLHNEYGNKVSIKWPDVAKAQYYRVYGDDGDGSVDWTFIKATLNDVSNDQVLYEWRSEGLVSGTYKYGIKAVGWDGSEEPNTVEVPCTITTYPLPVSGITFAIGATAHQVAISWEKPPDASYTHGNVYSNQGLGGEILWDSMVVQSSEQGTGVTCALPNDLGDWSFGVRSYNHDIPLEGYEMDRTIQFSLTAGWSIAATMTVAPVIVSTTGMSLEYWRVDWAYSRSRESFDNSAPISHFRIYGSGITVNYTTYLAAVTAGVTSDNGQCSQFWTSDGPWIGGTYRFGIKGITDTFWEGPAEEFQLFLCGTLPSMVTGITVATSQ